MSSSVEKIKSRLSIVDVISSYIKIEKAGANFRACCPFHNEKTPSFFISPSRDTFHCFGCSRGGDILTFVEEIEGLDFIGALKVLAQRAGVELESFSSDQTGDKEKLYEIVAEAARFYSQKLSENPDAESYLKDRGVKSESIKEFCIGYAPAEWQALCDHLLKKGYALELAERAGLAIKSDKPGVKKFYDRFRSRIMFPVNDSTGRPVGFSGRIFSEAKSDTAKYVNSPETPLYNKSRILFGYDKARSSLRRADQCVLVEGQFDLVMSHQAGVKETVAVSGTAFSGEHLALIKRLTTNIVMAFDPDLAGLNASKRAVNLALQNGFEVKIAELPADLDPADLIAKDRDAWQKSVKEAKHVIDFYLSTFGKQEPDRRKRAHLLKKEVYPYLAMLSNRIDESHFVSKVADNLSLPESVIMADLNDIRKQIKNEKVGDVSESKLNEIPVPKSRRERIKDKLAGIVLWQESMKVTEISVEEIRKEVGTINLEDKEKLILEAEILYGGGNRLGIEVSELLKDFKIEGLKENLAEAMMQLKTAESTGDGPEIDKWLKKCQDISREINNLR